MEDMHTLTCEDICTVKCEDNHQPMTETFINGSQLDGKYKELVMYFISRER